MLGPSGVNAGRALRGTARCERGDSNPHGLLHWILSPFAGP